MINKILFAADLGPYTPLALMHVESLARHFDAEIAIVHAVPPLSEFTEAMEKSDCSDSFKKELLQSNHVKGIIETVRDEVFEMIASNRLIEDTLLKRLSEIVIVPGKAAPLILLEAERLRVDCIVIGSHGADAFDHRVLGSVSQKVLQLAKVPVFFVPILDARALTRTTDDEWKDAI